VEETIGYEALFSAEEWDEIVDSEWIGPQAPTDRPNQKHRVSGNASESLASISPSGRRSRSRSSTLRARGRHFLRSRSSGQHVQSCGRASGEFLSRAAR
jgi:hypothetical protein